MDTESELSAATKVKQKKDEDDDAFRQRLVEAVNELEDEEYEKLTKPTRKWADNAIETFNETGKVPAFEDAEEEADESEAADDAEEEESSSKKKKKPAPRKKKVTAKDHDDDVQEEDEDEDDQNEETEEEDDMAHTDSDRSTSRGRSRKVKASGKKKASAGRKASDDKGASGQLALRKLLVRDPNMSTDDLTARLEKQGYELSSITISSQRSAFRNIVKILQGAGLLKKQLIN